MELQQFIEQKQAELTQQCRKVEVKSYVSVELRGRTVGEWFKSFNTLLTQKGREVTVNEFPDKFYDGSHSFMKNGTHVIFEVVAKGKRKPERKEFYFLWADGDLE